MVPSPPIAPTSPPFVPPRTIPPDRWPEPLPIEAIIFDVDGTLAETEEAHRTAFNRAFAEATLDWHWSVDDYRALLGTTGGRERIARYMAEQNLAPDTSLVAALHERKNVIYGELVESGGVVPRPGIVSLIEAARGSGIALAIATTTSRSNLSSLLAHVFGAAASDGFSTIVTGEDVVNKKPDPEVYQRALSGLGQSAQACLAIEDAQWPTRRTRRRPLHRGNAVPIFLP